MKVMVPPRKRKKGAGRPKGEQPPKQIISAFKGSEEFAQWFEGLIEHCQKQSGWSTLPGSLVIERALVCLAREVGYLGKDDVPPKR